MRIQDLSAFLVYKGGHKHYNHINQEEPIDDIIKNFKAFDFGELRRKSQVDWYDERILKCQTEDEDVPLLLILVFVRDYILFGDQGLSQELLSDVGADDVLLGFLELLLLLLFFFILLLKLLLDLDDGLFERVGLQLNWHIFELHQCDLLCRQVGAREQLVLQLL
jgi:hypothetical protein